MKFLLFIFDIAITIIGLYYVIGGFFLENTNFLVIGFGSLIYAGIGLRK